MPNDDDQTWLVFVYSHATHKKLPGPSSEGVICKAQPDATRISAKDYLTADAQQEPFVLRLLVTETIKEIVNLPANQMARGTDGGLTRCSFDKNDQSRYQQAPDSGRSQDVQTSVERPGHSKMGYCGCSGAPSTL